MADRHDTTRLLVGSSVALLGLAVLGSGCLKSLPALEDLLPDAGMPEAGGGSAGTGNADGGGSGGTGATGGAGATGGTGGSAGSSGGAAGTSGAAGAAGTGGSPVVTLVTCEDKGGCAVQDVGASPGLGSLVIAADPTTVLRAKRDDPMARVAAFQLAGGVAGVPLGAVLNRPTAMIAPAASMFFWAAGRIGTTSQGQLFRAAKSDGSGLIGITDAADAGTPTIGIVRGVVHEASTNTIYFTAGSNTGSPQVLSVGTTGADTVATSLYVAEANEPAAGDITVSGMCLYWIAQGRIYVINKTGSATRNDALDTPVNDAVGITSDTARFYYTRADGSVWMRSLSTGCDGSGEPEELIFDGFVELGDLVVHQDRVAWVATGDRNDRSTPFRDGGIFAYTVGGDTVEQIAPENDGVEAITHSANVVVYATSTAVIRKLTL